MRSWIYLLLAIGAEVIGTTSMKLAATHAPVAGMLLMYGMIGLSYFFLALAVKRVPVGVAYALWEGIGIVLITAVSVAWLGESIGLYKAVGLGVMIAQRHAGAAPWGGRHMLTLNWIPFAWLGLAIALEVVANLLLKYSDGFRRRGLGIASILCVMAAFTALAQAVKDIELSLAYAIWGGFGILATVAMGWALFGQRLAWRGWLGLLLLLAGMSLLKLA